jgi:hypothetical protein
LGGRSRRLWKPLRGELRDSRRGERGATHRAGRSLGGVIALTAWWFAAPQIVAMLLGPAADDREAQRDALVTLVRRLTSDSAA